MYGAQRKKTDAPKGPGKEEFPFALASGPLLPRITHIETKACIRAKSVNISLH